MNLTGFMLTLPATQCRFSSINTRKHKSIAYIYIRFNQKFDNKSYISTKFEIVNIYTHLIAPISLERAMVYFGVTDVGWHNVIVEI